MSSPRYHEQDDTSNLIKEQMELMKMNSEDTSVRQLNYHQPPQNLLGMNESYKYHINFMVSKRDDERNTKRNVFD